MSSLANVKHVYYYNTEDGMIDEANEIKMNMSGWITSQYRWCKCTS